MKKEEVKVFVHSKQNRKEIKKLLKRVSEKLSPYFYLKHSGQAQNCLIYRETDGWVLLDKNYKPEIGDRVETTFAELVTLVTIGDAVPVEAPQDTADQGVLGGKVAIKVNSQEEYEALLKHYQEKNWNWRETSRRETVLTQEPWETPDDGYFVLGYHDKFIFLDLLPENSSTNLGYKIVEFVDFLNEINAPKQITILKEESAGALTIVMSKNSAVINVPSHDLNIYLDGEDLKKINDAYYKVN